MPTLFVKIALEIRQICVMLSVFTTLVSLNIYTNYEQDKFLCLRLLLIVYLLPSPVYLSNIHISLTA